MLRTRGIKIVLFAVLVVAFTAGPNQAQAQFSVRLADSLMQALPIAKHDTDRLAVMNSLAWIYQEHTPDSSFHYGEKMIALALKDKNEKYLAAGYSWVGHSSYVKGNYPLALQMQFKELELLERMDDSTSLANAYNSIGNTYKEQGDFAKAKIYYQLCKKIAEKTNDYTDLEYALMNLGYVYEKTNQLDSALQYSQHAYELGLQEKYTIMFGFVLQNLATVQLRLNNKQLAESYYRMAIDSSLSSGFTRTLSMNFLSFANYFIKYNLPDSAIFYAKKALASAQQASVLRIKVESLKLLSEVYEKSSQDSAFHYQKLYVQTSERLYNRDKIAQVENLNYTEQLRQQEISALREKETEERTENLQYVLIALALVTLTVLFFLFSHSVLANQRLIRFLGAISLLIVFEFLNLLLHPWLGAVTRHSPALMLLTMVCVAAVLVPLHHRLEHWITHKLVEKNNRIRLAAAKRTIQQLEGSPQAVISTNGSGAAQGH